MLALIVWDNLSIGPTYAFPLVEISDAAVNDVGEDLRDVALVDGHAQG